MGGVLTHVAAGLICAAVVHITHFRFEFSLAIFIGNLLPDAIKFTVSGIAQGTMAIFNVEKDSLFWALHNVTGSAEYWMGMLLFVLASCLQLYHHKIIRKKEMKEIAELWTFLVAGILVHIVIDWLIDEKSPWI